MGFLVKQQCAIVFKKQGKYILGDRTGYCREERGKSFWEEHGVILGCSKDGDFSWEGGLLGRIRGYSLRRIIPANNSLVHVSTTLIKIYSVNYCKGYVT